MSNEKELEKNNINSNINNNINGIVPAPTLGDRLFTPIVITVVVCLLTAIIFAIIDIRVSAVLMGILFIVFGIIAIATIKITSKTWEILLLPIIGLSLTVIPAYLMLSEHNKEKFPPFSETTKLMFYGVLAMVAGFGMVIIPIIARIRLKKRCIFGVSAVCIDYVKLQSRGICLYRAVWEYCVNGQTYKNMDKVSSLKRKPKLGCKQTIWIHPNNPDEFYRRGSTGYIMFIVMGVSLVFVGGIILTSVLG